MPGSLTSGHSTASALASHHRQHDAAEQLKHHPHHSPPPMVRFGSRRSSMVLPEVDPTAAIRAAANQGAGQFTAADLRYLRELYNFRLRDLGTVAGVEKLLDDVSLLCAPVLIEAALQHVGVPMVSDRSRLGRVLSWAEFLGLVAVLGTPPREVAASEELDRLQLVEVLQSLERDAVDARNRREQEKREAASPRDRSTAAKAGHCEDLMRSEPIVLPRLTAGAGAATDRGVAAVSLETLVEALRGFNLGTDIEAATGITPRPGSGPAGPPKMSIDSLAEALAEMDIGADDTDLLSVSDTDGIRPSSPESINRRRKKQRQHARERNAAGGRGRSDSDGQFRVVIDESQRGQGNKMIDEYVAQKRATERARAARLNVENLVHGESIHRRGTMARMGTANFLGGGGGGGDNHVRSMRSLRKSFFDGGASGRSGAAPGTSMRSRQASRMGMSGASFGGGHGSVLPSAQGSRRRPSHALSISLGSGGPDASEEEKNEFGLGNEANATSFAIEDARLGGFFGEYPMVTSEPRPRINPLAWGKKPRSPRPWQTSSKKTSKTPDPTTLKSRQAERRRKAANRSRGGLEASGITREEYEAELHRRGLREDASGKIVPLDSPKTGAKASKVTEARAPHDADEFDLESNNGGGGGAAVRVGAAVKAAGGEPGTEGATSHRSHNEESQNHLASNLSFTSSRSIRSPRTPKAVRSPLANSAKELLRAHQAGCSATFSPEVVSKCTDEAAKLFSDGASPQRRKQIGRWLASSRVPGM